MPDWGKGLGRNAPPLTDDSPAEPANPAIALRLQSTRPVGRVAELGSLGRTVCLSLCILLNPRLWALAQILAGGAAKMRDDVAHNCRAMSLNHTVELRPRPLLAA